MYKCIVLMLVLVLAACNQTSASEAEIANGERWFRYWQAECTAAPPNCAGGFVKMNDGAVYRIEVGSSSTIGDFYIMRTGQLNGWSAMGPGRFSDIAEIVLPSTEDPEHWEGLAADHARQFVMGPRKPRFHS